MIWLKPWVAMADLDWDAEERFSYCRGWETELSKEVGPKHILFGKPAALIARRFDADDALFSLSGEEVAEVHLTWSRGVESDPRWPNTAIFSSLDEWARESMTSQHQEWVADR